MHDKSHSRQRTAYGFDVWPTVLATVFTVFCLSGYILSALVAGQNDVFATTPSQSAFTQCGLVLLCAFALVLSWLFRQIVKRRPSAAVNGASRANSRKRALAFFLCWIPYLAIRFPGNMDEDTVMQIMQTYGLAAASDHHPWFDTLVFGTFWHAGDLLQSHAAALLLFALVQMAITAAVFAGAIAFMQRRLNAPRWLLRLGTAFFALYPAIPLFAQSMGKEMLFGWIWVLFLMVVIELVRTRGEALRSTRFCLCLFAILCLIILTKKTGVELCAITAAFLLIYCSRSRSRLLVSIGSALAVAGILWTGILLPTWNVVPGQQREMLSIPIQQVAATVAAHEIDVTEEEWVVLDGALDNARSLGDVYVPTRADFTKDLWKEQSTSDQKQAFLCLWASWGLSHPDSYAFAFGAQTYRFFYPLFDTSDPENYVFYLDKIPAASGWQWDNYQGILYDYAAYGYQGTTTDDVAAMLGDIFSAPELATASLGFDQAYAMLAETLWPLFNMALFASWIPLFVLAYALHARRADVFICLVPTLVACASLALGPSAIPRYLVPFLYGTPLVLALLFMPKGQDGAPTTSSRSSCGTSDR